MIALDRLQQIIPSDIALANKALSITLQQISKNPSIKLKDIADATTPLRTCSDLPLVKALSEPVPESVVEFFKTYMALGSGVNGTFVIVDFFGSLAGLTGLNFIAVTNILSGMDVTNLQKIYDTMREVVSGAYGTGPVIIPDGTPGEGTYATIDNAFTEGLIPSAQTELQSVVALYPYQEQMLNEKWTSTVNQLEHEMMLRKKAGIGAGSSGGRETTIMTWTRNLPQQGLDLRAGGNHWFIQSIANMEVLAGQSIIGCLREGVNTYSMGRFGVNYATDVPLDLQPKITASGETGNGGSAA